MADTTLPVALRNCLHYAARYAMPRATMAHADVFDAYRANLARIPARELRQLANEIKDAAHRAEEFNGEVDALARPAWLAFAAELEAAAHA